MELINMNNYATTSTVLIVKITNIEEDLVKFHDCEYSSIDWGDGTSVPFVRRVVLHDYEEVGEYIIEIKNCKKLQVNLIGEKTSHNDNIIDVLQVGSICTDCHCAFGNCHALENIKLTIPSKVTSVISMFYNCTKLKNLDLNFVDNYEMSVCGDLCTYCSELKTAKIVFGNGIKNITDVFYTCENLDSLEIELGEGLEVVTDISISCKKITNIYIKFNSIPEYIRRVYYNCGDIIPYFTFDDKISPEEVHNYIHEYFTKVV